MFLATVESVSVEQELIDDSGAFKLNDAGLISYCHGTYRSLGKKIGTFGYSVKKKKKHQKHIQKASSPKKKKHSCKKRK